MKKHSAINQAPKLDADGYQIDMPDLNGEALTSANTVFGPFEHGGAHRGAGRKPSINKPVLLRLSPTAIALPHARAKAESKTLSDIAEQCIVAG